MTKFLDADINFHPDRITYVGDKLEGVGGPLDDLEAWVDEWTIMHEWETDLMEKHAKFVCERGGDILEIGFGMGISAGFIQDEEPTSHTIIELHPQIAEKAREWAADKPNVTIIEGDWLEVLPTLMEGTIQITPKKFDGFFFDPYGFWSEWSRFADMVVPHCKATSRLSHWNCATFEGSSCGFMNHPKFTISFDIIEVNPPENDYFNLNTYYLPKVLANV